MRARDGSTLVVLTNEYRDTTYVRIYDDTWRPTTPLLQADVTLRVERGLRQGFVAWAERSRGRDRTPMRGWVVIDSSGRIRPIEGGSRGDQRVPLRAGDLAFTSPHVGPYAYRTSRDAVVTVAQPDWYDPATSWSAQATGSMCFVPVRGRLGDTVRASIDEGLTWHTLNTDLLPAGSGPRLQSCIAQGNRVTLMTGGESPRWLHTLDRTTGALLSSHVLMTDLNGYDWRLLPDGTLVAGTNRPGLMVAADNTNQDLEFRPGPVVRDVTWTEVLDGQIVLVRGRAVHVSDDRGLTWREVDLGLDG